MASTRDRRRVVPPQLRYVRQVLGGVLRNIWSAEAREDALAAGALGLARAYERYDGRDGVTFLTYAAICIRSAALDHLRDMDLLSRTDRKRVRQGLDEPVHRVGEEVLAVVPGPDHRSHSDTRLEVEALLRHASLAPRERRILRWYYWQDEDEQVIARRLGCSQSRVNQVRRGALGKLRAVMGGEHE